MIVVKMHKWKLELNRQQRERERKREREKEREREREIMNERQADRELLMLIDGGTLLIIQFLGGKT